MLHLTEFNLKSFRSSVNLTKSIIFAYSGQRDYYTGKSLIRGQRRGRC